MKKITYLLLALSITSLASSKPQLKKTSFDQLPGWQTDAQQNGLKAFKKSCRSLIRTSHRYKEPCQILLNQPVISKPFARHYLKEYFTPYKVIAKSKTTGLFTGYYEPSVKGSLTKTSYFDVPIYAKPKGLVKVDLGRFNSRLRGRKSFRILKNGRYYELPTRKQISDGPLLKGAPILVWVHSKVDRFFLQIQGSGSVILRNGKRVLLGYDGQNGKKYYAIGRYLIQIGALTRHNVSMQSIRDWLSKHPHKAEMVMNKNPSFVFFRRLKTDQPIGAHGVEVTPMRTLAVDPRYTRLGTLVWLATYLPLKAGGNITEGIEFQHLMVAQDTGGEIKGPIRGDVFFGSGTDARWLAGHMQSSGRMWVLLPKKR